MMYRGIYIGGHDIREYGARLQTDYSITGYEITNTTSQGPNRSNVLLLRQSFAPLHITLPLDFYGGSKAETMARLSAFSAVLAGTVEVDLGDGYQYTCILDEIGETSWINDEICSVDVTLSGYRHTEPMHIESNGFYAAFYNPGTWPCNACKITIYNIRPRGDGETLKIDLRQGSDINNDYLLYKVDQSLLTGSLTDELVLDGITMHNSYMGAPIPAGNMQWTDYPFIMPDRNFVVVSGVINCKVKIDFTPVYF